MRRGTRTSDIVRTSASRVIDYRVRALSEEVSQGREYGPAAKTQGGEKWSGTCLSEGRRLDAEVLSIGYSNGQSEDGGGRSEHFRWSGSCRAWGMKRAGEERIGLEFRGGSEVLRRREKRVG